MNFIETTPSGIGIASGSGSGSEYNINHVKSSMDTEVVSNLHRGISRDRHRDCHHDHDPSIVNEGIKLEYIEEEEDERQVSEVELTEMKMGDIRNSGMGSGSDHTLRRGQGMLHAESPVSTLSQGTSLPSPPSTTPRVKSTSTSASASTSSASKRGLVYPCLPPDTLSLPHLQNDPRSLVHSVQGRGDETSAGTGIATGTGLDLSLDGPSVSQQSCTIHSLCLFHHVTKFNIEQGRSRTGTHPFGDLIPTSVTVETARFVAQFSAKASEDWVRKFRFDEVCWPDVKQLVGIRKQNTNATMEDIGRASVSDVKAGRSVVVFGHGVNRSGRVESMFGSVAGEGIDHFNTIREGESRS